jgi:asparagine synthase (glutamine-hydrolysing)
MCGINGFNFSNIEKIKKMMTMTASRGPDASGVFENNNITLSHNRLSIIDLSKEANQPLTDENLTITFNGEIYNYRELKEKLTLKGHKFKTNSDTEVIVKLYKEYGDKSFSMLSGIFALALWDENSQRLKLIRDIVGVKPLYYYHNINEKKFYFSSLIKSIVENKDNNDLNENALNHYSNFWHNDLSETFFKGIHKVQPGELITFQKNKVDKKKILNFEFSSEITNPKNEIERIFNKQFISDVPVSLSLSGGVDSNLIFYFMNKNLNKKFKTYSVSFEGGSNFDADMAEKNSKLLNFENERVNISSVDFIENIEKVVEIMEEPVGNQNSIANYILSKKISEKVLFTGDGGDEIFTGYDKYKSIYFLSNLKKLGFIKNLNFFSKKNSNRLNFKSSKEYYLSFSEANLMSDQESYYKKFTKTNSQDLNFYHNIDNKKSTLNNVMFMDLQTWIQNDSLARNDKLYMDSGIEVRVPFLDNEMIEKFLFMSEHKKINFFKSNKPYVRKLFSSELANLTKKKQGFNSPFSRWLQNELYDFAKIILSKEYYNASLYLDYKNINKFIDRHKSDKKNSYLLWSLVVLQIFFKKNNF